MKTLFLAISFTCLLYAADPPKLDPVKALKIANLEAKRNGLAAEFQSAILQAERLQKAVQDADASYRSAIESERAVAKLDASCKLVENTTWECPAKPATTPKPSTPEKAEKLEKEKP